MKALSIGMLAALALPARAQTENSFSLYPGKTTFASRNTLGKEGGDVLQLYAAADLGGVGDDGGLLPGMCRLSRVEVVIQDQDLSTREPFEIVFRRALPSGAPQAGAAGVLLRSAPVRLPVGTGQGAFRVSVSLGTTCANLPCGGTPGEFGYHAGVHLPAASNWTDDGLSLHAGAYRSPSSFPEEGDDPRGWSCTGASKAPDRGWSMTDAGVAGQSATLGRTWNLTLFTCATGCAPATLQVGAIVTKNPRGSTPNYGIAGIYPCTNPSTRGDGLAFRISDHSNHGPGVFSLVWLRIPSGRIPVPGFCGSLHGPIVGSFPLSILPHATPVTEHRPAVFAPGAVPPVRARVGWQAATIDFARFVVRLTNGAVTHLDR